MALQHAALVDVGLLPRVLAPRSRDVDPRPKRGIDYVRYPILDDGRYGPENGMFSPAFIREGFGLFDEAEHLATNPVTLRRVQIAKISLIYLKLCQDLGFTLKGMPPVDGARPATRDRAAQDAEYSRMIDELVRICNEQHVTNFSESTRTLPRGSRTGATALHRDRRRGRSRGLACIVASRWRPRARAAG